MGTNTDPYQRAEGRYRLMPGIIRALARVRHAVLDPHQGHAAGAATCRSSWRPAGRPGRRRRLARPARPRSAPLGRAGHADAAGPAGPRAPDRRRGPAGAGCSSRRCCRGSPTPTPRSTPCSARSRRPGRPGRPCSRCTCGPGTREWFHALARPGAPGAARAVRGSSTGAGPTSRRPTGEDLEARVAPLLRRHGLDGGGHHMGGRSAAGRAGAREPGAVAGRGAAPGPGRRRAGHRARAAVPAVAVLTSGPRRPRRAPGVLPGHGPRPGT